MCYISTFGQIIEITEKEKKTYATIQPPYSNKPINDIELVGDYTVGDNVRVRGTVAYETLTQTQVKALTSLRKTLESHLESQKTPMIRVETRGARVDNRFH